MRGAKDPVTAVGATEAGLWEAKAVVWEAKAVKGAAEGVEANAVVGRAVEGMGVGLKAAAAAAP